MIKWTKRKRKTKITTSSENKSEVVVKSINKSEEVRGMSWQKRARFAIENKDIRMKKMFTTQKWSSGPLEGG